MEIKIYIMSINNNTKYIQNNIINVLNLIK